MADFTALEVAASVSIKFEERQRGAWYKCAKRNTSDSISDLNAPSSEARSG